METDDVGPVVVIVAFLIFVVIMVVVVGANVAKENQIRACKTFKTEAQVELCLEKIGD